MYVDTTLIAQVSTQPGVGGLAIWSLILFFVSLLPR